jgi:hypothetical protein
MELKEKKYLTKRKNMGYQIQTLPNTSTKK